jgi:O-antigen/teichoic acid export membrane protein
MFDIALLVFFCVMTFRIVTAVRRESKLFQEFRQPGTSLSVAVMLFPIGPIVMFAGTARLPFPLAFVGAAACYVPALFVARRISQALERTGTDRVKPIQSTSSQAFGTALVGLGYVVLLLVFAIAVAAMNEIA